MSVHDWQLMGLLLGVFLIGFGFGAVFCALLSGPDQRKAPAD